MNLTIGPVRQLANWPVKESGDLYESGLDRSGNIWYQDYSLDGQMYRIIIPEGFRYDGTTMSRFTSFFIGLKVDGIHRPAVVLHDYLYFYEGELPEENFLRREGDEWAAAKERVSRLLADELFFEIMRTVGVKSWRAGTAFRGVRTFGGFLWADQEEKRPAREERTFND